MRELDKVVHQWCDDNDRWMYIEYDRDGIVMGLNFMQGEVGSYDDYKYFKDQWCHNDESLMAYYEQMLYTFPIEKDSVDTLTFINKCMWSYHAAIQAFRES